MGSAPASRSLTPRGARNTALFPLLAAISRRATCASISGWAPRNVFARYRWNGPAELCNACRIRNRTRYWRLANRGAILEAFLRRGKGLARRIIARRAPHRFFQRLSRALGIVFHQKR